MIQIAFRCDSSHAIGTGHVARCLTLAHQFRRLGYDSIFLCREEVGHVNKWIEENGFKVFSVGTDVASCYREISAHDSIRALVVDHYSLDETWEKGFFKEYKIWVIDDLHNRKHLCHALLDTNFRRHYDGVYAGLVPVTCQLYLGPSHSLLRHEFIEAQKHIDARERARKNQILVFFGGGDPTGETLRFIKSLNNTETNGYHWAVMAASSNKYLREIQNLPLRKGVTLHVQPPSVARLMAESFYYFGSGGTVTWERLFMGLSGDVVSVADNQQELSSELHWAGLQNYLGDCRKLDYGQCVQDLCKSLEDRKSLTERENKIAGLVRPLADEILKKFMESH